MQTIKTTWMANTEVQHKKKNTNYFEGKPTSQDKNAYEKSEFLKLSTNLTFLRLGDDGSRG